MLEHINLTACPDCGDKQITSAKKSNQHCNKEWNEDLQFRCGYYVHYSPNFSQIQVRSPCTNTNEYKEYQKKRRDAKDKVITYINKLNVDQEYKKKLLSSIQYN